MYTPHVGRWLSRDPAAYVDGPNQYLYVKNGPTNAVDPSGLWTIIGRVTKFTLTGKFNAWYALEKKDGAWWSKLPKCPCKIEFDCVGGLPISPDAEVWLTPKPKKDFPVGVYFLGEFVGKGFINPPDLHPGAEWDMRQVTRTPGKKGDHGNQCTYDDEGDLITGGLGAGTADKRYYGAVDSHQWDVLGIIAAGAVASDKWKHLQHDVIPFWAAWILDKKSYGPHVAKYLEVRPTVIEAGCDANVVGGTTSPKPKPKPKK